MTTTSSQLECIFFYLCKHCDLYIHQKAAQYWSICKQYCVFFPSYQPQMSLLEFQLSLRFPWIAHLIDIPLESFAPFLHHDDSGISCFDKCVMTDDTIQFNSINPKRQTEISLLWHQVYECIWGHAGVCVCVCVCQVFLGQKLKYQTFMWTLL